MLRMIPGVQNPHWKPCSSMNACWIGCRSSSVPSPSIVVISLPSACIASMRHEVAGRTVEQHGARAALALVARHPHPDAGRASRAAPPRGSRAVRSRPRAAVPFTCSVAMGALLSTLSPGQPPLTASCERHSLTARRTRTLVTLAPVVVAGADVADRARRLLRARRGRAR